MNIRKALLIQLALLAVALIFSLAMAAKMPDIVPTHWDAAGHANGYGSKWTNLLLTPGMMVFIMGLTWALPKMSPKKFEIEPFEATYSYLMVLIAGMMLCIHLVIVQASAGAHLDITRVMMAVLFAFFGLMGNVLGKIKPNFYMGIRTPWTLSNEQVWHITHRYAGRLWVAGGVIGVLATLIGVPFWILFSSLMLISFAPVVKSYFIYRGISS